MLKVVPPIENCLNEPYLPAIGADKVWIMTSDDSTVEVEAEVEAEAGANWENREPVLGAGGTGVTAGAEAGMPAVT